LQANIDIYGSDNCEDTARTRKHLESRGIPFNYIDIDENIDAERKVKELNNGRRLTPTVIIEGAGNSYRVAEPSNEELDRILDDIRERAA